MESRDVSPQAILPAMKALQTTTASRPFSKIDPKIRDLVLIFLCIKATFLLLVFLNQQMLPFNRPLYVANLVREIQGLPDFMRAFNTWDTQHYLILAEKGYGTNAMSNAFYPLYPWLIRLATPVFNNSLVAALVVANLVSLLVPVYMYKLAGLFTSEDRAFRATLLLLAFPTAFFLSVAYSEALFLALTLMAFFYLYTKDVLKASLCCLLLPLVRAQGLLMVVPILWMAWTTFAAAEGSMPEKLKAAARAYAFPVLASLLGIALYLLVMKTQTKDFLTGFEAQAYFAAQNSIANLFNPYDWFMRNFVEIKLYFHGFSESLMDRVFFFVFLPALVGIFLTQDKALFFYAAMTMLIPALSGTFMSYTRFLLVVFPIPLLLSKDPRLFPPVLILMFSIQIVFFLSHTGGFWIA